MVPSYIAFTYTILQFFHVILENEAMTTKINSNLNERNKGRMRGWWTLTPVEYDLLGHDLFALPFHIHFGHSLSSQVREKQWSAGEVTCNTSTCFLFVLCVYTENWLRVNFSLCQGPSCIHFRFLVLNYGPYWGFGYIPSWDRIYFISSTNIYLNTILVIYYYITQCPKM